jgi:hypothetical protein
LSVKDVAKILNNEHVKRLAKRSLQFKLRKATCSLFWEERSLHGKMLVQKQAVSWETNQRRTGKFTSNEEKRLCDSSQLLHLNICDPMKVKVLVDANSYNLLSKKQLVGCRKGLTMKLRSESGQHITKYIN